MRLHRFHGGLHLPGHKAAAATPIRACPLPALLRVPLLQHAGAAATACVEVGQQVAAGEPLGRPDGSAGAWIHAPAAGEVVAIEARDIAHPSGLAQPCVDLRPDGSAARWRLPPWDDWATRRPADLRARIAECGVVGLGGAVFPTVLKLADVDRLLVLNGAECEPWIACDERLMIERADEVVAGGRLLRHVAGAARAVIAVEDRMATAAGALREVIGGAVDLEVVSVPTVYPQGGERQLIRALTGLEVPRGGLPRDIGVLVHNIATAAACWRAVALGEPLTRRIVSVGGPGVAGVGCFEVAFGTPIGDVIAAAGGYTDRARRLLQGGPLMGLALPHDGLPVTKATNCLLVLDDAALRDPAPELPCIRCGACADACPAGLLPQQLLAFGQSQQWQRLVEHGLQDCIECGCCDLVCPSHIPLVEHYRYAKTELRAREREAVAADAARARHLARAERQRAESQAREQRLAARLDPASPEAVQAAIARAEAKRLGSA